MGRLWQVRVDMGSLHNVHMYYMDNLLNVWPCTTAAGMRFTTTAGIDVHVCGSEGGGHLPRCSVPLHVDEEMTTKDRSFVCIDKSWR